MVMRSFKIIETVIPVEESEKSDLVKRIKEAFGRLLSVRVEGKNIVVSGERLADPFIHKRLLEMARE